MLSNLAKISFNQSETNFGNKGLYFYKPSQYLLTRRKLKSLNEQVERYEAEISQTKQSIMDQMQDAEVLTYDGQTLATWKAPKPSLRLDAKLLSEEHPNLVHQYQVPIQNSRRLVIKKLS